MTRSRPRIKGLIVRTAILPIATDLTADCAGCDAPLYTSKTKLSVVTNPLDLPPCHRQQLHTDEQQIRLRMARILRHHPRRCHPQRRQVDVHEPDRGVLCFLWGQRSADEARSSAQTAVDT
jgi:hypothetical protein